MKKVFMTLVATLFVSATLFAANKSSEAKWEGNIDSYKLGEYLKLNSDQSDEVSDICDYFAEQMQRANSSKSDSKKLLHNAVYGNLKLMKKVLTSAGVILIFEVILLSICCVKRISLIISLNSAFNS